MEHAYALMEINQMARISHFVHIAPQGNDTLQKVSAVLPRMQF